MFIAIVSLLISSAIAEETKVDPTQQTMIIDGCGVKWDLVQDRLLPALDKNNAVIGFRAVTLGDKGVPKLSGLKNGDIILKLNDTSFDSAMHAMQAFKELGAQNSWVIEREGKKKTIPFKCPLKK